MSKSRYSSFVNDGANTSLVPFVKIPKRQSDYYVYYEVNKTRLDKLSYEYYGNPNYGWLILQANPSCSGLEFNIEDKTLLRIPFPLDSALNDYENKVKEYKELYGF